jgi:hypothetical protein
VGICLQKPYIFLIDSRLTTPFSKCPRQRKTPQNLRSEVLI